MVGSICVGRRSKKNNVEMTNTRKVHPVLAFVAALLGFGLGYVYIGKARAGVAVILSFYLMVVFFAWTRMLVYSAAMLWLMVTLWALLSLLALLHPIILAVKNRAVPARRYNRWWFYVLWVSGWPRSAQLSSQVGRRFWVTSPFEFAPRQCHRRLSRTSFS